MKTILYVDGFNLYYGALKDTSYKWLNIQRMAELLLPRSQIVAIKYFTARISARPNDPHQPIRQQIYLRALRTLPSLEIFYGHYLSHNVFMPRANPRPGESRYVEVIRTEEKGSDVNIAVHALNDAYQGAFELAVLVSNDSDLVEVIKVVRRQLGLRVGVLNPQTKPARALQQEALFVKQIRENVLQASQFPATMTDATGTFRKPKEW